MIYLISINILGDLVEFLKKNNNMKGTIKKIVDGKNFGFIAREGEVKDLFFHANEVKGVTFAELKEGDVVTFEVVNGEKGPSATGVSRE